MVTEGHWTCTVTKVQDKWIAEAWVTGFPDRVRARGEADGPIKALKNLRLVERDTKNDS